MKMMLCSSFFGINAKRVTITPRIASLVIRDAVKNVLTQFVCPSPNPRNSIYRNSVSVHDIASIGLNGPVYKGKAAQMAALLQMRMSGFRLGANPKFRQSCDRPTRGFRLSLSTFFTVTSPTRTSYISLVVYQESTGLCSLSTHPPLEHARSGIAVFRTL